MKKSIFALLTTIVLLTSMLGGTTSAATTSEVNAEEARYIGNYFKSSYGEVMGHQAWIDSTLSDPVVFNAVDGTKVAYEYQVVFKQKPLGYIVIAATKDLPPLLEAGVGRSPSSFMIEARDLAVNGNLARALDEPVFLWWGATTYSVQFGSQMREAGSAIQLQTGRVLDVPKQMPTFAIDEVTTNNAWVEMASRDAQTETVTTTYHWITGVPSYYQQGWSGGYGDDYDQYASYPTCRGTGADPWDKWDGCSAIAGAMILGYWDYMGYSSITNGEDLLIDDCHHWMHTSFDGWTNGSDIDDGLENLFEEYGYNDFSVRNDGYVEWSDITIHIDNNYPEILSFHWHPTYGDHSVTVVGYIEDGDNKQIIIHDTKTNGATWVGWGTFAFPIVTMCNPT